MKPCLESKIKKINSIEEATKYLKDKEAGYFIYYINNKNSGSIGISYVVPFPDKFSEQHANNSHEFQFYNELIKKHKDKITGNDGYIIHETLSYEQDQLDTQKKYHDQATVYCKNIIIFLGVDPETLIILSEGDQKSNETDNEQSEIKFTFSSSNKQSPFLFSGSYQSGQRQDDQPLTSKIKNFFSKYF